MLPIQGYATSPSIDAAYVCVHEASPMAYAPALDDVCFLADAGLQAGRALVASVCQARLTYARIS